MALRGLEIVICNVTQPADIPDALQKLPYLRLWRGLSCLVSRDRKGASWQDMIRALCIDFEQSGGTYLPRYERFLVDSLWLDNSLTLKDTPRRCICPVSRTLALGSPS